MRNINIVTFGLTLQSDNKGCEALAYSFFYMLDDILKKKDMRATVSSVVYLPYGETLNRDVSVFDRIDLTFLPNRKKSLKAQGAIFKAIRNCDLCVDFTDGDSFSDIYGKSRFYWRTLEKTMVLCHKKRMLLGPQTYGPYRANSVRKWASWVLKKADYVYSRDEKSAMLVKELTGREIEAFTDIAFALPAIQVEKLPQTGAAIGLNISALLWNGGYTGENQFGLTVDYHRYITDLIEWCTKKQYEIYLIPHVICTRDEVSMEDDLRVCRQIADQYPQCHLIGHFDSPMTIKGYIAQMDVFIGARMHSTIGAFSMGVPTIPFAYSKKFGDLFHALGYSYLIDGRSLSTEHALELTQEYISDSTVGKKVSECSALLHQKSGAFVERLSQIIDEVSLHEKKQKKHRN